MWYWIFIIINHNLIRTEHYNELCSYDYLIVHIYYISIISIRYDIYNVCQVYCYYKFKVKIILNDLNRNMSCMKTNVCAFYHFKFDIFILNVLYKNNNNLNVNIV